MSPRTIALTLAFSVGEVASGIGGASASLVRQLGTEFSINTETLGDAQEAAVAIGTSGSTLFAWSVASSEGYRIDARFMSPGGEFAGGPETISDPPPPPLVHRPRLTRTGGGFLAVWDSFPANSEPENGARAQFVDEAGDLQGPDFGLSASSLEANFPNACVLPSGDFLAGWSSDLQSTYRVALWARRFNANGEPLTGDVRLDNGEGHTDASDRFPRIACGVAAHAVVVWLAENPENRLELFVEARIVGLGLDSLSPVFRVSETPVDEYYEPEVVLAPDGSFTVLFMGVSGAGFDILARRFAPDGTPLAPPFVVNDYLPGGQLLGDVASDSRGNFAVAWEQGVDAGGRYSEIYARVFLADGTPYGPSFHVNPDPSDDLSTDANPAIALSDEGVVAVAWQSWLSDGEDYGLRGARFRLGCSADAETLCLEDGRFEVRSRFRTATGLAGPGAAIPLGTESGAFSFFASDNVELIAKVLDGCGVNDRFWIYLAGLTNVEVEVTVTDAWTGRTWAYENPVGARFPPLQDVEAFDACAAAPFGQASARSPSSATAESPRVAAPSDLFACVADAEHLCLLGGRFRARASFATSAESAGSGVALPLGDQSGMFWFFWPENLELVVKALDGCVPFEHYWLFAAGLTNLEVSLEVEDLATGAVRDYRSPLGAPFQPIQDTTAFGNCGSFP